MPIDTIISDQAAQTTGSMGGVIARLAELFGTHRVGLVLKLGISVGLVALVCRNIDGVALVDRLSSQSVLWLAATALLGLLQIGLLGLRWQQILKGLGGENGLRSALAVTFMGCFFGAFLFGPTGGDVARAVLARPRSLGRGGIVHSVLFERLASVVGLGLAAAPFVLLDVGPQARSLPAVAALSVVPLTFLGMALAAWLSRTFGNRAGALFGALRELGESWKRLVDAWPRLAIAVALATLGQLLVAVEAWCLGQAQHLSVSLIDFAILMPPVMLIVALPVSAGGWGVREGAIVAALAMVGVGTAPALLLSVELGLIGTLISLPGGLIWLYRIFSRQKSSHLGKQGMA